MADTATHRERLSAAKYWALRLWPPASLVIGLVIARAFWPAIIDWGHVLVLVVGLVAGSVLRIRQQQLRLGRTPRDSQGVVQDINALRQAFGVLKQQVSATIQTSETAVMSMMERMNRVHRNAEELRSRVLHAVERSHSLSSETF